MTTNDEQYVPDEQDLEVAWIESEASADDINVASAEQAEALHEKAIIITYTPKVEAILMDGFDMAVADRLADAGYTEYAEDEDGGVTWVSAPLGEVLHIVRISATEYETGDRA